MITDSQREMMSRVLGKTAGKTLKRGARGVTVRALQLYLRDQGFDIKADGVFGKNTEAALKQMQSKAGISADGRAGSKTFGTIGKTLSVPKPVPRPEPATMTGSAEIGSGAGAVPDKPVTLSPVAPPTMPGSASIGSGAGAVADKPGPVTMEPPMVPPPAGFSDPSTFDPRPDYESMVPKPGAGSLDLPIAAQYRNDVRAKEYSNAQDLTNALGMAVRSQQMAMQPGGAPSAPSPGESPSAPSGAPSLRDALIGAASGAQMQPPMPAPQAGGEMMGAGLGAVGNAPPAQGAQMPGQDRQMLIRALLLGLQGQ